MPPSGRLFSTDRRKVLITGFKPFLNYETNPSWEGVRYMDGARIAKEHSITLLRMEMPVSYAAVDAKVPKIWQWYQPDLTIHVGLNEEVKSFVLEKQATKRGYRTLLTLDDSKIENPAGEDEIVYTTLKVDTICEKFNHYKREHLDPEVLARSSKDAGKYVCKYIYYTSLCQEQGSSTPRPTLFVHVPLHKYSTEQLAQGLERILELCLQPEHNIDYYKHDVIGPFGA
ncbi:hypothetical protein PYW07_005504 [Mythimna separata]|uniref:Pyroglutamyl-peptidase 1 n=1 Tax=Mythimna separata TaxID=271217 RepID=A0AAD7YJ06_MYTSE|nr:hypothetical protein PYW07_005504 [Mythimna separata]